LIARGFGKCEAFLSMTNASPYGKGMIIEMALSASQAAVPPQVDSGLNARIVGLGSKGMLDRFVGLAYHVVGIMRGRRARSTDARI
jgi:hypothetical protein